jgi:hypothetical protein
MESVVMQSECVNLDPVRRCMLREPVAAALDLLASASPANRCLIVAKVVHEASRHDAALADYVEQSGIMEQLRQEAMRRTTGERTPVVPLAAVRVEALAPKEKGRV